MTNRRLLALTLTAVVLAATPSQATFHLWTVNEVYSNADGTVQYIELFTVFGGQQFLGGNARIQVSNGSTILAEFIFDMDSPAPTANRTLLIGTASLENVQVGVTPDFFIDANFIDVIQASQVSLFRVDLQTNFDTLSFVDDLPLDDANSLDTFGGIQVASPMNFAGEVGVVPEPKAALLQTMALLTIALLRRGQRIVRPIAR
jgi:serralysin